MNESCHIWMSHVTYEWVMSHTNESCYIWMSHVTHASHMRLLHAVPPHFLTWVTEHIMRPLQLCSQLQWPHYVFNGVIPSCAGLIWCCSGLSVLQWPRRVSLRGQRMQQSQSPRGALYEVLPWVGLWGPHVSRGATVKSSRESCGPQMRCHVRSLHTHMQHSAHMSRADLRCLAVWGHCILICRTVPTWVVWTSEESPCVACVLHMGMQWPTHMQHMPLHTHMQHICNTYIWVCSGPVGEWVFSHGSCCIWVGHPKYQ